MSDPLVPRTFELDVRASLDDVWAALTTAEGLACWYVVDAEVDLTPGGTLRLDWGAGMQALGEFAEIDPPRRLRLVYGDEDGEPTGAEEWLLDHAGGVTHVRLIHSLPVAADNAWDDAYPGIVRGWSLFMGTLQWVLDRGLPLRRVSLPLVAPLGGGAWHRVLGALGLGSTPAVGARIATPAGDAEVLVAVDGYSLLLAYDHPATLLTDVEGDSLYTLAAAYDDHDHVPPDLLELAGRVSAAATG